MITTAPQHAERILEACQLANPNRFESELENAWHSCRTQVPTSGLEWEQQELLETIVEKLRGMSLAQCAGRPSQVDAEFALLKHLRRQGLQMPTRPEYTSRLPI